MERILPISANTVVRNDGHEWIPRDFGDSLIELEHVIGSCPGSSPLFRGHADTKWLLESSFVRTCKKVLFGKEPHVRLSEEIRGSVEYHQALFGLLLLKHRLLARPSDELEALESEKDIDATFELLKRCQQYPSEDKTALKGTFFLDWSQNRNVGLFFANLAGDANCPRPRASDGALFICDKTATGKTLMTLNVEKIIDLMVKARNEGRAFGCPLLFHPPKQLSYLQGERQAAVYWAQMETLSHP